ncbi:LPS-assembly protein LptD [Marinobacter sp. X15-166B]|uniref:LPS-assembly protein LptD n=1 Tax=Marinobacter sp. X15-166B TaxID=1897620 RepID=UPI00085BFB33|nr:LPS-assembly protein LptD [Marinobacter sp. X15-166B]OEY67904.1 LPS biosynthesis protein [Marinobacter sp. X15-166B]
MAAAVGLTLVPFGPALARPGATTAAEMDWRPRAELPVEVRNRLPAFCEGGYLPLTGEDDQATGADGTESPGELPLNASGLYARYEIDSELVLRGGVELSQGAVTMSGEEARYNQRTGHVRLTGPLVSRGQGFLLTGEEADYDVHSGQLNINTASFLMHSAEMRGVATSLSRVGPSQVDIRQGRLTTCAPDRNDWMVVATDIHLDRAEGFGTAKHVRLEVQDVPVFYWPYISFPIDERRKSGFLYPAFGTANTGSGLYLAAPYYLNLAPHYDATVTPQYMHGRGLLTELEGRYLSSLGQTSLQLGYIDRDRAYARAHPGDNGQRWALDFDTRARFGHGWSGYGEYSVVSDGDYLSDLNRSLDISEATHLQRRGGVRYFGNGQYFELYANGYQTLADRIAERNKPYSQLPEAVYGISRELGAVETSLTAQYTHFYRDNDTLSGRDRANGQRLRVLPQVALPLRALWGYTRPAVTLDHTEYRLTDYTPENQRIGRTVPVFEWDSGLYFDRQSSLFAVPYNQTLEPRLYYAWADAEADQNRIPVFDSALRSFSFDELFRRNRFSGGDRVGDANQLTVALTSRYNDLLSGAERFRWSLGQVYYYADREVTLDGLGAETRSDSPLAGEAVLRPLDGLELRTSLLWDARTRHTEESRSQLVFHSPGYRYLASLGHTYSRGQFEQSDVGAVVPVTDKISLIGRWVYDTQLDRTVGTLAGFEYNNCCWSVQLVSQNYLTSAQQLDNRILFQIQLKGLGGSGGASSKIAEAIHGFEERESLRYGTR